MFFFFYYYVCLVEIFVCLEVIELLMVDFDILFKNCWVKVEINCIEVVGVSEVFWGILFYYYKIDEDGLIKKVNLIIVMGNNNLVMNKIVA